MALEPLNTDETLDAAVRPEKDMDAQMIFGCSGFLVAAVAGYLLSIWPFVAFQKTEQVQWLLICFAAGPLPATILGIYATRKFGLGGACGFIGGALCTGVFLFLRIQHSFVSALAQQAPRPGYPEAFQYLVPGAYILACLFLAILVLPKDEFGPSDPAAKGP